MNRRDFIKFAGFSAGLLYTGSFLASCEKIAQAIKNPLFIPSDNTELMGYFRPRNDQPFTITSRTINYEFISGKPTNVFVYEINSNGKTFYNPIIVLEKGNRMNVSFLNRIGEESIIHWHGFRAHWLKDGHPYYTVQDGQSYNYGSIPIVDRSGNYFYHPHPHGKTGLQVYKGLSGLIIIEDSDEEALKNALDLQYGVSDIPLIIQDKTFNENGDLIYKPVGMNGNMGFWGESILVNWTLNPYMEVARRIYRFRILNGSNARPYRLVLLKGSNRIRFWVIGVEGGLLEYPQEVDEILVAPGERIDILIDFRDVNLGDIVRLYNLRHNLAGMGGNMQRGMMNLIDREFEVLEFRVAKDSPYDLNIPGYLSTIPPLTNPLAGENIILGMSRGTFTINGSTWDESGSLNNPSDYGYNYSNGDVIEFIIQNTTGMYHPMHFHGFQFQIVNPRRPTDLGWKDTVIVAPHETVKVRMDMKHGFAEKQWYLIHCHILEHHDAGMMIQYSVTP